jgi:AcrR family transcriptional regulator
MYRDTSDCRKMQIYPEANRIVSTLKTPMRHPGRPREFDIEEALDKAMLLFWEHGYDGTSLAELSAAMGITKPSLYAAFGDKEQLFEAAVARYAHGPNAFTEKAFTLPTARAVVLALLEGVVNVSTLPSGPRGCLDTQATLAQTAEVRDSATDRRLVRERRLEVRFREAQKTGELPKTTDCAALARYVTSVGFGITVQGASGESREHMKAVVDLAMSLWPGKQVAKAKAKPGGVGGKKTK